jgi:hypothetical protein
MTDGVMVFTVVISAYNVQLNQSDLGNKIYKCEPIQYSLHSIILEQI